MNNSNHIHHWSSWRAYDEHVFDSTKPFRYWRDCQISGCTDFQKTEDLLPSGNTITTNLYIATTD